jgi:DNA polymerase III subunit epsilon
MLPHGRPLSEVEFVAFDLETTGLFPVVNRIVEFGAVRFRLDGQVLGTWEQLVDPEYPIPPSVTEIHGITDSMVRGQPTLIAYCHTAKLEKTYRLDRIREVHAVEM